MTDTTIDGEKVSPITRMLAKAPSGVLALYGAIAAFGTYFSMYAFRKPFSAISYEGEGEQFGIILKTVFVLSQLFGYLLSKYLGIKICPEITRKWRYPILIGMIVVAELALVLFGALPVKYKLVAIFINGLPLGMVWGVCVLYLEGRKITEFLIAGLACSYIVSSGIVKDVGRWILSNYLADVDGGLYWMPAVTGLIFLPLFLLFSYMLNRLPAPTKEDEAHRTHRQPMGTGQRGKFLKFFWVGIVVQLMLYFFITAFREVRDNYGAEIFDGLGLGETPAIFSKTEMWVGLAALTSLIVIRFFNSEKWGAVPNMLSQLLGFIIVGVSTIAFATGALTGSDGGYWWMVLIGVGAYLTYVPSDTIFYERVIARAKWVSTAVFMTYVMDATGYTGSAAVQLYKNFGAKEISWVQFLKYYSFFLAGLGLLVTIFNLIYFPWRGKMHRRMVEAHEAPEQVSGPA